MNERTKVLFVPEEVKNERTDDTSIWTRNGRITRLVVCVSGRWAGRNHSVVRTGSGADRWWVFPKNTLAFRSLTIGFFATT